MVEFAVDEGVEQKPDAKIEDKIEKEIETEKKPDSKEDVQATVEELATGLGWNDDFKGEGKVSAADYIRKSRDIQDTMRTHIKDQKKQNSDLAQSVKDLKVHNETVYKVEISKLKTELKGLKEQKKEAIEDGDVAKVDELDEQIDGVKEAMVKPKEKAPVNLEYEDWVKENLWYKTDSEMATYADAIADQNEGAPFKRVADLIGKKMKEMFPDKFKESETHVKKTQASPVEGAIKKSTTTKFTKADLSDSQRSTMAQFVKMGATTEAQYIKDIATLQEV